MMPLRRSWDKRVVEEIRPGDIVLDQRCGRAAGGGFGGLFQFLLEIRAGRSLAIVGDNGAGKTTPVKLLARLYNPDEAHITVLELCDGRGGLI
jgi:ABC-type multidrug transport system fused ATPase/permease subunit